MNRHMMCVWTLCATLLSSAAAIASPAGSGFTYQGVLKQDGAPASGRYNLRFQLWDSLSGGSQVGSDIDLPSVSIANGLFTAELDFGLIAFNGAARWLQIQIVTNGGSTVTPLVPRQPVSPTPYALYALNADGPNLTNLNASHLASGTVPNAQLSGTYSNSLALTNLANTFVGNFAGSGASLSNINASNIASGTLPSARLPAGGAWTLSSNLNLDANTLVIDQSNNRIGIGTAAPASALHVVGNTTLAGDVAITGQASFGGVPTLSATTRTMSVNPAEFELRIGSSNFVHDYFFLYSTVPANNIIDCFAPLSLPNGAVITDVTFVVRDFDSTKTMTCSLMRDDTAIGASAASSTTIGTGLSSSNTSTIQGVSISGLPTTINNVGHSYILEVSWAASSQSSSMGLYRVEVTYTITAPLP